MGRSAGIVSFLHNDSWSWATGGPRAEYPPRMERRAGTFESRGAPARRNPRLNQPTLTMDTIGAVGRVAAIFTPITPSHSC